MSSEHDKIDTQKVIASLNTILELELAGVVRYVHYSLMVFGHARIPIIGWMRNQAIEGMNHASIAGEHTSCSISCATRAFGWRSTPASRSSWKSSTSPR